MSRGVQVWDGDGEEPEHVVEARRQSDSKERQRKEKRRIYRIKEQDRIRHRRTLRTTILEIACHRFEARYQQSGQAKWVTLTFASPFLPSDIELPSGANCQRPALRIRYPYLNTLPMQMPVEHEYTLPRLISIQSELIGGGGDPDDDAGRGEQRLYVLTIAYDEMRNRSREAANAWRRVSGLQPV